MIEQLTAQTKAIAKELGVVGLMNIQYAVRDGLIYVLEVNPRASRTIPFVSKATGVSLAGLATKVIMGKSLKELAFTKEVAVTHVSCKEAVFPFTRFSRGGHYSGPEMKSTGEVMGIDHTYAMAFAKSQLAAGQDLPLRERSSSVSGIRINMQSLSLLPFCAIWVSGYLQPPGPPGFWRIRELRPLV
jgi:carbamoyl-phosphate synthase large subunit